MTYSSPIDPGPTAPTIPSFEARQIKNCRARPFVYVVRFCGTAESSIASAIRQGIGVLDNFLQQQGVAAGELVVVYRNRLPDAVTLQIGFPVKQRVADAAWGEVFSGTTPSGRMVSMLPGGTLAEVLSAGLQLPEGHSSFTWQTFRSADYRPWREHPSAPLMAPADLVPAANDPS